MTFRAEVAYLEDCDPGLVTVNAEEYKRVARLIDKTMPEFNQVKTTTEWKNGNRELFDRRLDETVTTFRTLGAGFAHAGTALGHFAPELKKAKEFFAEGDELGKQLRTVIKSYDSRLRRLYRDLVRVPRPAGSSKSSRRPPRR